MTMMFIRRIILSFPKQVVNVVDLGYLGVEKDFPRTTIIITLQKEKKSGIITRRKRLQQNPF